MVESVLGKSSGRLLTFSSSDSMAVVTGLSCGNRIRIRIISSARCVSSMGMPSFIAWYYRLQGVKREPFESKAFSVFVVTHIVSKRNTAQTASSLLCASFRDCPRFYAFIILNFRQVDKWKRRVAQSICDKVAISFVCK